MRMLCLFAGLLAAAGALPASAEPEPNLAAFNFAVMRNGQQIGNSSVRLQRNGRETVAEMITHVRVRIGYVTVYRFDQTQTERWADGRLVALNSVTDDNGTAHRVNATRSGNALVVDADGRTSEIDPAIVPASPWNAAVLGQRVALNPQDGTLSRVSVTDHGKEELVLSGRTTPVRHYSIETSFTQDVWYDDDKRLVRVELRAGDGSKIQYRLG